MSQAITEAVETEMPLPAFNFQVAIEVGDLGGRLLCNGSFGDVTGLEASMEPRTIRVGGRNHGPAFRAGPVSYATVVLKRGMTAQGRDLWAWWALFAGTAGGAAGAHGRGSRATVHITQLDTERQPAIVWRLHDAMPVRFKAGDLSAKGSELAVEELHLVHEGLEIEPVEARS